MSASLSGGMSLIQIFRVKSGGLTDPSTLQNVVRHAQSMMSSPPLLEVCTEGPRGVTMRTNTHSAPVAPIRAEAGALDNCA